MRKVITTTTIVKPVAAPTKCQGCKPAPWEKETSCNGLNCSKNLKFLLKKYDNDLRVEARKEGYVSLPEIYRAEGRMEAAEVAHEGGHITDEELKEAVANFERMKEAVPLERSTLPRWSPVAMMRPPNLQGITLSSLVSAAGYMDDFAKRCEKLRKEQHGIATAKCSRIKAGLEKGNFKSIWARAKACQAVYTQRKKDAKEVIPAIKSAIWGAEQREIREYEAGYTVVKGKDENGAYLFPKLSPNLERDDLAEMVTLSDITPRGYMKEAVIPQGRASERAATLAHIIRLDGYDFTVDYPVPDVVEEEEVVPY